METERFHIRKAVFDDFEAIINLYKTVSKIRGGLARIENEITDVYVKHFLLKSAENGLQFVIIDRTNNRLIAEIHCYQLEPTVFAHILSELTVAVNPAYQGMGLGKKLFQTLLDAIQKNRPDVFRVELIVRESNKKAIKLYESLGFKKEGRLEGRIKNNSTMFEADIPMAWFNPSHKDS